MQIFLNGAPHSLPGAQTIAQLIETLGYAGKRIAVERNGDIVPKGSLEATTLTEGDRIEIVVAVGGG